jgi:hypothetical protein
MYVAIFSQVTRKEWILSFGVVHAVTSAIWCVPVSVQWFSARMGDHLSAMGKNIAQLSLHHPNPLLRDSLHSRNCKSRILVYSV